MLDDQECCTSILEFSAIKNSELNQNKWHATASKKIRLLIMITFKQTENTMINHTPTTTYFNKIPIFRLRKCPNTEQLALVRIIRDTTEDRG